jgi:hypothetical protein
MPQGWLLDSNERGALIMLANSPRGVTEALLFAHGFKRETIAGLIHAGLATVTPETVRAGGRTVEVGRVRITNMGQRALAGTRPHTRHGDIPCP